MIVRIVKMSFKAEHIKEFQAFFKDRKDRIKSFDGCRHLELWQDSKEPHVFFTYSLWDNEQALNHYRFSEFFKDTWTATKAMFLQKAEAWSVMPVA
jgi:hypothetical protein